MCRCLLNAHVYGKFLPNGEPGEKEEERMTHNSSSGMNSNSAGTSCIKAMESTKCAQKLMLIACDGYMRGRERAHVCEFGAL